MPKHYKGRKARKNPIEEAIQDFNNNGKNQICNAEVRSIVFLRDSFLVNEGHQGKKAIKIFDTSHCSNYVDNIAIFASAAEEMLAGRGINKSLNKLIIEFDNDSASDDKFTLQFDDSAQGNQVFMKVTVSDLKLFATKTNLELFLATVATLLGLEKPANLARRYGKSYGKNLESLRVGIDKYIQWEDQSGAENLSQETQQAQEDINIANATSEDTSASEEEKDAADILKESAEDTLATNAINHPENKKVVNAALENVPAQQLDLILGEAQQELEDIEQQNAQVQSSSASRQEKEESAELTEESVADFLELRLQHLERLSKAQQAFAQTPPPPPSTKPKPKGKESFSFNQDNFQMSPAVRIGTGNDKNLESIAKSLRNRLAEFIDYESIDGIIFYNVVLGNRTSAQVSGDVVTITVTKTSSIEDAIEALAYAVVPLYEDNSFKFNMDGYLLTDTLVHIYDYA
jgi:hypothetical protein